MSPTFYKTIGYLVSTVSVILIGVVAWDGLAEDMWLRALLIIGITTSIVGMIFRMIAHLIDHQTQLKSKR